MRFRILPLAFGLLHLAAARHHYVPHTHLDMGWLSTIEEYFVNNVKPILDSLVPALNATDNETLAHISPRYIRKFSYNDLGFLRMWIRENNNTAAEKVAALNHFIERGRFELVGTGMVMADTACPHYEDFVNNFFAGIGFTQSIFHTRSQSLWQLDSFGQSAAIYYIATLFGIQDTVFPRIHQQIREAMQFRGLFEFVWQLPRNQSINVHLLEHYGWTGGMGCANYCPWSNLDLSIFNIFKERGERGYQKSPLVLMGDDFEYKLAGDQFRYIEKAVINDPTFTYSTMAEYLDDFYAKDVPLKAVSGDFLPYMDVEQHRDVWTGYFTTKPNLKYQIRYLQQLHRGLTLWALSTLQRSSQTTHTQRQHIHNMLVNLAKEVALALHHDFVTGTAVRNVDTDYMQKMSEIQNFFAGIFGDLTGANVSACEYNQRLVKASLCQRLWERLMEWNPVKLHLLNPAPTIRLQRVRMAVPKQYLLSPVLFYTGENQVSFTQAVCLPTADDCILETELFLSPLGETQSVVVRRTSDNESIRARDWYQKVESQDEEMPVDATSIIRDVKIMVTESSIVVSDLDSAHESVVIELLRMQGSSSNQYISSFAPGSPWERHGENRRVRFYESRLDEWGAVVTNSVGAIWVHKPVSKRHFEVELLLNSDTKGNENFEIALRLSKPDLGLSPQFWVESNGLFEVQRQHIKRLPEFSIYPTTTKASLRYVEADRAMTVWSDRSRGVMADSHHLYLFVQRSGLSGKGNPENLSFYDAVFTRVSVQVHRTTESETAELFLRNAVDIPTLVFFETQNDKPLRPEPSASPEQRQPGALLPHNVRVTAHIATGAQFIVRFQNVFRKESTVLMVRPFLEYHFPSAHFFEVDFSTVIAGEDTDSLAVRERIRLAPLEYMTVLVTL